MPGGDGRGSIGGFGRGYGPGGGRQDGSGLGKPTFRRNRLRQRRGRTILTTKRGG